MQPSMFTPSARLAPFVDRYRITEVDGPTTRVLLPELGVALAIHFDGASSLVCGDTSTPLADVVVTGVQGAVRRMHSRAHTRIAIVNFRPGAARAFFGVPMHELHDQTLAFEGSGPLREQLEAATDHPARIMVLETFLLSRLRGTPDPLAMAAVRAIEDARGSIRIDHLARSLGISQDPLEKRFRRAVGASPKQLASLARIRHAIELGRRGTSWSRVAHQCGYYDQSHLIREFRIITGEPPAQFVRAGHPSCSASVSSP
jgi:AraC-like DNA-binding protein